MQDDKNLGCFGSPLIFSESAARCSACPVFNDCSGESKNTFSRLQGILGHAPLVAKKPGRGKAGGVPKKAEELLARLRAQEIDIAAVVKARRNPFKKLKPAYMESVLRHLYEGGIRKKALISDMMTCYQWSLGTASSHASLSIDALVAAGAAWQDEEGIAYPVEKFAHDHF